MSANFDQRDPPGTCYNILPETNGAILALEEVNSRADLLPSFELDLWSFTSGLIEFNTNRFEATVMPYYHKFGAALLSSKTIEMMKYLRLHGIFTPVVGVTNTRDALFSPTDFPGFIRVCLKDSYVNGVMVQTLKKLAGLPALCLGLIRKSASQLRKTSKGCWRKRTSPLPMTRSTK